jgi:hypothetical protein
MADTLEDAATDGTDGTGPAAQALTYNGRSLAYEAGEGRPSRVFLEGSASDIAAYMPDPLSVIRMGAAIAEAHDASAPMQGMAIVESHPRKTVGHVRLENAGLSTHVAISLDKEWLSPEAAVELAAALLYHAAAARATHDLDKGFAGCSDAEESKRRGPPRIKTPES